MALPITIGSVRYPGIKVQDTRIIRLLEVLLHGSTQLGGWTAKEIHHAVLTAFHLPDNRNTNVKNRSMSRVSAELVRN
jgi:hypothetical protein